MALTRMPNISKVVAEKLMQVGITTPEELKALSTEHAFIRLLTVDDTAYFSMLQGLEGAIQGSRSVQFTVFVTEHCD